MYVLVAIICQITNIHSICIDDLEYSDSLVSSNIQSLTTLKVKASSCSRPTYKGNFDGEILKLMYFEEKNFVNFYENKTKISGICGEIWNMLADYLNFTLVPSVLDYGLEFGYKLSNGTYTGLLGKIQRNETQIMPKTGVLANWLDVVDYTIPLWKTRYRLFIKPEWQHDGKWLYYLFTPKLWYSFITVFFGLAIAGCISQKCSAETYNIREKYKFALSDYIFYMVATLCCQGCVPDELYSRSKLIYIVLNLFSWTILIAFSSNAISRMMHKTFSKPFKDVKTLIRKSKYSILAIHGSVVYDQLKKEAFSHYRRLHDHSRLVYYTKGSQLYEKLCSQTTTKFAVFDSEDRQKAMGSNLCSMRPVGSSYYEMWITSAIKKGFKYKRSFDIGILKLHEVGLVDGLKERFLTRNRENKEVTFKSIDLTQVYWIFGLLLLGMSFSLVIVLVELWIFRMGENKIKEKQTIRDSIKK